METERGTICETYELIASTVPVPEEAVVLGVIDADGASVEISRYTARGGAVESRTTSLVASSTWSVSKR